MRSALVALVLLAHMACAGPRAAMNVAAYHKELAERHDGIAMTHAVLGAVSLGLGVGGLAAGSAAVLADDDKGPPRTGHALLATGGILLAAGALLQVLSINAQSTADAHAYLRATSGEQPRFGAVSKAAPPNAGTAMENRTHIGVPDSPVAYRADAIGSEK